MTDFLLRNARIWTGDPGKPRADAAVVREGRFAFVGRERDADGEPTGILLDHAARLITDVAPKLTQTERIGAVESAIAHAHSLGVTGVHAMDVGRGELQALHALNDSGKLRFRVRPFLSA